MEKELSLLIERTQKEWQEEKEKLVNLLEGYSLMHIAKKYKVCEMFNGKEDLQGVVSLLFEPQGVEFCQKTGFPSLETFREYLPYKPQEYGVYIDAHRIRLENPKRVLLVGKTEATIVCDQIQHACDVYLMHGAKATIMAKGYSVVFVKSRADCKVEKVVEDKAIVL